MKVVLKMFLLLFYSYSEKYTFSHPIPKLFCIESYLNRSIFVFDDSLLTQRFRKFDLWSFDAIQNTAHVFKLKIDTFDMI